MIDMVVYGQASKANILKPRSCEAHPTGPQLQQLRPALRLQI